MDMTSMIDIVFLLISFFMIAVNFSNAEQNAFIRLPKSELAVPPKVPPDEALSLQVTEDGLVLFNNQEYEIDDLERPLSFERRLYDLRGIDPKTVVVLVRGDGRCETGKIQRILKECQEQNFETFNLKAIAKSGER